MRARLLARLTAAAVTAAAVTLVPGAAGHAAEGVVDYSLVVDGETATGHAVLPEGSPTVLVVLCHGYGGSAFGMDKYLTDAARRGWAGVAMNYRGWQSAWKVWTGWQDTVAATLDLKARYPSITTTIIYGISMGGEVSGLSVAYAPPGTYQYWVEDAGVENLTEEWTAYPDFHYAIETETGGTPAEVPQAYADRSPVSQAERIAAHGLRRAFLNHAAGDSVVTPSQAQEMTAALADAGVPVSAYTFGGAGHVAGWGYQEVVEKALGRPDWPDAVVQGVIGPNGFTPAISPS
ncbi:MAG TPA: alpha/beta fold hydrolase [Mycobacteriales bacterium]|jgi:dipeptidyl aminopeptidase/acylaminoacyl peptidase